MKKLFGEHYLIIGIILGVILGAVVGSFLPELGVKLGFLGTLFLNALKMIVLPLIVVSITLSIMNVGNLGSLGIKTLIYYLFTTSIAVFIGILVVNAIHPGDGSMVQLVRFLVATPSNDGSVVLITQLKIYSVITDSG